MAKRGKKKVIHKKQHAKKITTTQSWQDYFNNRLVTIPWIFTKKKSKQQVDQYIPRISRIISRITITLLLLVLVIYSSSQIIKNIQKPNNFQQLQQAILSHPVGGSEHNALGQYYEANDDIQNAKKEYVLAQQFGDKQASLDLVRLAQKERAPQVMQLNLLVWQRFVTEHPDYRDGWMEIATLWWMLGDKVQAETALKKVLMLDSAYAPAIALVHDMHN